MPEEDEGLFETVGRAADKIGETSMGKRIGAIFTVLLLAALSGGALILPFLMNTLMVKMRRPRWWLYAD